MKINKVEINRIGDGSAGDKYIYVENGSQNKPALRFSEAFKVWQVANDGLTWENIGTPAPIPVSGKGYVAGGYLPTTTSSIVGLDFNAESIANISAILSIARGQGAGANSDSKGYCMGGGSNSNEIDGLVFATEAAVNYAAALSTGRVNIAGLSSTTKGYAVGGQGPSVVYNIIDGTYFSSDTSFTSGSQLDTSKMHACGISSGSIGYIGGGDVSASGGSFTNVIEKLVFSNDARTTMSIFLALSRARAVDGNNADKGIFIGGRASSPTYTNEIDGVNFSNETLYNPSTALGTSSELGGGLSSGVAAYYCGGYNGSAMARVEKFNFSSEGIANLSSSLPATRYFGASFQPTTNAY